MRLDCLIFTLATGSEVAYETSEPKLALLNFADADGEFAERWVDCGEGGLVRYDAIIRARASVLAEWQARHPAEQPLAAHAA